MESKKLITLRGGLLLILLLLAAATLFVCLDTAPQAARAVVEIDGTPVFAQDLTALTGPIEETFAGKDGHTVVIRFTQTGAQFISSTCPDQTCVRSGQLTRGGETALCLPARVVLRLDGLAAADAVTY